MSQFQEIFTYQENNSIEYILQEFRENYKKDESLDTVLCKLYFKLSMYISPLINKWNMIELRDLFSNTSITVIEADDHALFKQLIEDILNNKNERDILQLAIDFGTQFVLEYTLIPTESKMTHVRDSMEAYNLIKKARDLEDCLKENLQHEIFCEIPNFWDNFFMGKEWTDQTSRIWESYEKYEVAEMKKRSEELEEKKTYEDAQQQKRLHGAREEKILVVDKTERELWDWLKFFEANFINQLKQRTSRSIKYPIVIKSKGSLLRGRYCRTNSTQRAQESTVKTQIDFLIKNIDLVYDDVDWKNINIAGQFTKSSSESERKNKFLQLSRCVREAYCAQPLRRFMHGFITFKDEFELWVFDRSGVYSSGRKSFVDCKEMFVRAICSYLLMSDEELGRDMSILKINGQTAVNFTGSDAGTSQLFEIRPKPVVQSIKLVAKATTCYVTNNKSSMIKYSWSRSEENTEIKFMKEALSVPGVVRYITSQLIYQTNSHLESLNLSGAKPWDLEADNSFISLGSNFLNTTLPSLERNRFLFRIAMTPCGRKIYSSGTIFALVVGVRDAIRAHQALVDKSILHADISEGNIILKDPTPDDDFHGMLIDLDCSVRLRGNFAEEEEQFLKGTLKLMALERLMNAPERESIPRSYRHDLESFFYVLLIASIEYEWLPKGKSLDLDAWCGNEISSCKCHKYFHISEFETLLDMFTPSFEGLKGLAWNLRTILFKDGIFFGTPEDRGLLYRKMIMAFDDTIEELRAGRIANPTFVARRR